MSSSVTSLRPRAFVITGCGRSGTMFSSRVLTSLRVPCSHEKVFTGGVLESIELQPGTGESSWLAAPHLDLLPSGTLVVHQIRHPLETIGSYLDSGWFRYRRRFQPLWKHCARHLIRRPPSGRLRLLATVRTAVPEIFDDASPVVRAACFWVRWNELVETEARRHAHDYVRYRLEDLNVDGFDHLLGCIGVEPRKSVSSVLAEVGADVNARPRRTRLTLDDLGPAADAVERLARSYGYEDDLK